MNQNKSNVPVSVAEEPDELSYYRLTLLSFLRESHPDLADDESFVATRSERAAEAFSAAVHSGLTYERPAFSGVAFLSSGHAGYRPLERVRRRSPRRQRTQRGLAAASRMPEGLRRLYALG